MFCKLEHGFDLLAGGDMVRQLGVIKGAARLVHQPPVYVSPNKKRIKGGTFYLCIIKISLYN
jgi:hypothetical protein